MRFLLPLSLLLTIFQTTVNAFILPFEVRTGNDISTSSLRRRDPIRIGNTGNAQYVSNITLGGVTLPVLLDTGSSDLWVHFPDSSPSMKDTGKQATLSYAVGKAGGNIQTTQCRIGNITVEDQAFLNVVDTSTFAANFHLQGYDGLLGLGPNSGSIIRKKVGGNSGNSFLQRVLQQVKTTANYITFLLDRKNDNGSTVTGQFTINEILTVFSNITSMPKLDVDKVNRLLKADQHWQALTDRDDGIIGPDGNPVRVKSIVPNAPKGQFVAVIDSGFTFSQVPREVSDAIYGRVRGAYYDSQNEWWLVPCGQYLKISFNFAGVNYPIHPFDTVDDNFAKLDSTGKRVCIGAFQPITSAFSLLGHYDMILGMSFLRNAYTFLDFGNWVDSGSDDHPYIQMLPITNMPAARSNFIRVRLGGNDTISDSRWSLLPVEQMQHSPVSEEEKKKKYQEMILSRWPYIFTGCFLLVALSVGFCIWRCCKKRRARRAKAAGASRGKNFDDILSKDLPRGRSLALSTPKRQSYVQLETKGSTTDLRPSYAPGLPPYASPQSYAAHDSILPQYSPHHQDDRLSDYSATQQPGQPDYRHSDFSQYSNHSQQSLPHVYNQSGQGGYPQHGAYQQHRS